MTRNNDSRWKGNGVTELGQNAPWWKTGVIYQIYPRSFQDSNGDGIGDLAGIRQRLDYLEWLGVAALWLSPIYESPMADFGYDVSDYAAVDPMFGTIDDFDALVAEAHARGLKIIMDFVPNHTSNLHRWFLEARTSRDNPKRDWYVWADPNEHGGPPNNWLGYFGGPAWTLDEKTGQYYLHNFLPEQPDLNYRNPEVKEAVWADMRFWLDRGIDGFRLDVIDRMLKDPALRNNPANPDFVQQRQPHPGAEARLQRRRAGYPRADSGVPAGHQGVSRSRLGRRDPVLQRSRRHGPLLRRERKPGVGPAV